MTTIDLSPLYRSSIGFDRMGRLLDNALRSEKAAAGFPPYDIETTGEDRYAITLAVAGCKPIRRLIACEVLPRALLSSAEPSDTRATMITAASK